MSKSSDKKGKSTIRHIACPPDGEDIFATAEFEFKVTTWSLRQRKRLATFDTGLDYGGRRLAIVAKPSPTVLVGAWNRHGICAYEATSGDLLWQRKDLKKVQRVYPFASEFYDARLGVDLQYNAYRLLDLQTGEERAKFRDTNELIPDFPRDRFVLLGKHHVKYCNLQRKTLWSRTFVGMVRSAAMGPDAIAVVVSGLVTVPMEDIRAGRINIQHLETPRITIFAPQGEIRWTIEERIDDITWSEEFKAWVAIVMNKRRSMELWIVDTDGNVRCQNDIGSLAEVSLMRNGRFVVTSLGQVLKVPSLEMIWEFDPQPTK